jgi:hypothetical protein
VRQEVHEPRPVALTSSRDPHLTLCVSTRVLVCRLSLPLSVLADSMLPEGAHLRESDWTVSFLTNAMITSAHDELQKSTIKAHDKLIKDGKLVADANGDFQSAATIEPVELQAEGYLCMLNLVRTKMDASVSRGAIAICTRHRFYAVFKPMIMLALDQYFGASKVDDQQMILYNLYHTLNNLPLHQIPSVSPIQQRLHRAVKLRTATNPTADGFFVRSMKWYGSANPATSPTTTPTATSPGAGGVMQTPSPLQSAGAFHPPPLITQRSITHLTSPSNSGIGIVHHITPGAAAAAARIPISINVSIPVHLEADEVVESSVTSLINRFRENVTEIYGALLAEKRVLFLGYQQPAAVCCDCVLAACLLISPPVVGTIHRAFPYANLNHLEFLEVYVAMRTGRLHRRAITLRANGTDWTCC